VDEHLRGQQRRPVVDPRPRLARGLGVPVVVEPREALQVQAAHGRRERPQLLALARGGDHPDRHRRLPLRRRVRRRRAEGGHVQLVDDPVQHQPQLLAQQRDLRLDVR
jgi:hypothetical protein